MKPLDPLRLRRAVREILDGGEYFDDSYQPVPVLVDADAHDARGAARGA